MSYRFLPVLKGLDWMVVWLEVARLEIENKYVFLFIAL